MNKNLISIIFYLFVSLTTFAQTDSSFDPVKKFEFGELRLKNLDTLKKITIVENGRLMPLDSFARLNLLKFSGRVTVDSLSAIEWLARVFFTPNETHDDRIFLVDIPEVLNAMEVQSEGRGRYSLNGLMEGLPELERLAREANQITEENRTIVERGILRLWSNVGSYANLLATFTFTHPNTDFTINEIELANSLSLSKPGTYSYLDIALERAQLSEQSTKLGLMHAQTGGFSQADQTLLRLTQSLSAWESTFVGMPLPIIPIDSDDEVFWANPWEVLNSKNQMLISQQGENSIEEELLSLRDMHVAYLEGRQLKFDLSVRRFLDKIEVRTFNTIQIKNTSFEIFYNEFNPFRVAKIIYAIGLLILGISFLWLNKILTLGSAVALIGGFIFHTSGLVLRMLILSRPPVTNLFETFIFVSWASIMFSFILIYNKRKLLGLFIGLLSGLCFLVLSGKFSAEGDTMPVLQAVLDTNFWLSTHVIIVTLGYMTCCVSGIIGHVYMFQTIFHSNTESLKSTYKALFGTLAAGLIFSFIGTMLGGIWADQSWGRFWGWDPKENGALMIVLWCAILFHARMGKMINNFGMAAGSAILIVVVMMAWFGINQLGVGLHSYGFTDGILFWLIIYTVIQITLVVIASQIYRKQRVTVMERK